jgi:hypothetical protein
VAGACQFVCVFSAMLMLQRRAHARGAEVNATGLDHAGPSENKPALLYTVIVTRRIAAGREKRPAYRERSIIKNSSPALNKEDGEVIGSGGGGGRGLSWSLHA